MNWYQKKEESLREEFMSVNLTFDVEPSIFLGRTRIMHEARKRSKVSTARYFGY